MHTNHYPLWKNILLILVIFFALIYALPNLYGDDPAIQITSVENGKITDTTAQQINLTLNANHIPIAGVELSPTSLLIRFRNTDNQLKAKDILKSALGDNYTIALNLAPTTPNWLRAFGATPMKLGLDLRGGIHFTLEVDADSVISQRLDGVQHTITDELRDQDIRYIAITKQDAQTLWIAFRDEPSLNDARAYLTNHYPKFQILPNTTNNRYSLWLKITPEAITDMRQQIMDQTMTTLRNRVNELGISEATVQQAGENRIAVEMPGVLDSAHAKQILGGTATLEFRLVDTDHDPNNPLNNLSSNSTQYIYQDRPYLIKNQVILSGNSITDAQSSADDSGRPAVNISLGGGDESLFHRTTAMNIGKPMAIIYVETKLAEQNVQGKNTLKEVKTERVISVASILNALGNNFQITGLSSPQEAQNLALLLRAGALPATINIVEERTLGPKLGMENIHKGITSIAIGMLIVILFMAFYYQVFGLIADLALVCNLLLLVALLSALGMTLTLPGIAGIVLTVGMAVDANVLIFERIREELRHGTSIQASILAGYERAFTTIVDANVTTLIVALVLFGIGTGPIKGFAVTLSVGILTSMINAIAITRALVNAIYGNRRDVKKLNIGI